jgi:DNA mismatch repair protein MutS
VARGGDGAKSESLAGEPAAGTWIGLGWVELSTGAFELEELPEEALADELARLDPAEVLVPESLLESDAAFVRAIEQDADAPTHAIPDWRFQPEDASRVLREHYGVGDLGGFGLDGLGPAIQAAGTNPTTMFWNWPWRQAVRRS